MNSEEHSEVFVDSNDQRDCPVGDDSVEVFGCSGPEHLDERCWCAVFPSVFWTHYVLFCCGEVVTKLLEKEFETPGNTESG
jgi:hypothetical protein